MKKLLLFILLLLFLCINAFASQSPFVKLEDLSDQAQRSIQAARNNADYFSSQIDESKLRAYLSQTRQFDFDVIYYDLHVTVDEENHRIETATNNITSICKIDGLNQIQIDLADLTVDNIKMNGTDVNFDHTESTITIDLDSIYNEGDEFTVSITYHGQPSVSLYFFDNVSEISVNNAPGESHYWFPCVDDPSEKADSVSTHITLPEEWLVVSNGLQTGIVDHGDGTRTTSWHTNYPMAPYLTVFAASTNYEVHNLEYVYGDGDTLIMPQYLHAWDDITSFEYLSDMMIAESAAFGQYPFIDEKYSQVSFSIFTGGMENQTNSFIHTSLIDGSHDNDIWLFSHELAHQWWGDCVAVGTWADIWLAEGFASYSETIYTEYLGWDVRTWPFQVMLPGYLSGQFDIAIYDPPPGFILYSPITYEKAGLVLHMIRGIVGEENFFEILQNQVLYHQYSSAVTEDFKSVVAEVYPDYDWDLFFQQWIYEPGHPIFDIVWDYMENEDGSYQIETILTQVQDEEIGYYVMPSQVGSYYTMEEEVYELSDIQINDWATYTSMNVENEPLGFAFDPWLWFIIKEQQINQIDKFRVTGLTLDDSNGNQILESGETADIVITLQNNLLDANNIIATLSTDDPNIEIIDPARGTASFGDIPMGGAGDNSSDPFQISIIGNPEPHNAILTLDVSNNQGMHKTIEFELFVGLGDILFIDDDNGETLEDYYIPLLDELNLTPHIHNGTLSNPHTDMLLAYNSVLWFTGNATENTLTGEDIAALTDFLDNGGNLFLTGQNIGDEISGTDFFTNYLHSQNYQDDWNGTPMIKGVDGDPIGDGITTFINGGNGADNQDSPGVVNPTEDAFKVFGYGPMQMGNAVRYEGDYKVVYFAFGLEGINSVDTRQEIMTRTLDYLGVDVGIEKTYPLEVPAQFTLKGNYPNPFNPATTIQYELPTQSDVKLSIYDVNGKLVKTLIDKKIPAGYHTITWNGTDQTGQNVNSGLYLYRLESDGVQQTHQMLLIK